MNLILKNPKKALITLCMLCVFLAAAASAAPYGTTVDGDHDAPVTLVAFVDFQDPFGKRFFETTYPQLREDFVKEKDLRLVIKHFPLGFHENAENAAIAYECVAEIEKDAAFGYLNRLFENQRALENYQLVEHAIREGVDQDDFKDCFFKESSPKIKVKKDMAEGNSRQVTGVPTFFVRANDFERRINGANTFHVYRSAIKDALDKNKRLPRKIKNNGFEIHDRLEDGEEKLYYIDERRYKIRVDRMNSRFVEFEVNGEETKSLSEGDWDWIQKDVLIRVTDIDHDLTYYGDSSVGFTIEKKPDRITTYSDYKIKDILEEGEERLYTLNNKKYEIRIMDIDEYDEEVMVSVNGDGERIKVGNEKKFADESVMLVHELLVNEGGDSLVEFYFMSDFSQRQSDSLPQTITVPAFPEEEQEIILPKKEAKTCTNGCTHNNICLDYGTRLEKDDSKVFCALSKELEEQKPNNAVCQNNYECQSNQCMDGVCGSLKKELKETRGIMEEFLNWLQNLFG